MSKRQKSKRLRFLIGPEIKNEMCRNATGLLPDRFRDGFPIYCKTVILLKNNKNRRVNTARRS
jgi:hypothetical protein